MTEISADEGDDDSVEIRGSGGRHVEKENVVREGVCEGEGAGWSGTESEGSKEKKEEKKKKKAKGSGVLQPCAACGLPATKKCNACLKVRRAVHAGFAAVAQPSACGR